MNDARDAELNAIGVLKRREIEARLVAPLVEALGREFGRDRVLEIVRETVIQLAEQQGRQLVQITGGNSLREFTSALPAWTRDDALELTMLTQSEDELHFQVTRCRYAEMYEALGLRELGAVLSCERDGALMAGFNPDIRLDRPRTILGGAPHCDFHYSRRRAAADGERKT
jgi:L-2-amino-thiazoline-4-carboxylic acid hydrolase-like protein